MHNSDSGFTLIEALVAMTVLAMGAVSLLAATEGHTSRITALIDRTTARWVAENALTEMRLGIAPLADQSEMLGQNWRVATTFTPTSESGLQRVAVSVGHAETSEGTIVALTGYSETGVVP